MLFAEGFLPHPSSRERVTREGVFTHSSGSGVLLYYGGEGFPLTNVPGESGPSGGPEPERQYRRYQRNPDGRDSHSQLPGRGLQLRHAAGRGSTILVRSIRCDR